MSGVLIITMAIILVMGILPLSIYLLHTMQGREPESSETLDEEMTQGQPANEPFEWWEARRGRFNRGLAMAGVVSGVVYYLLLYFQMKWYGFAGFRFNWVSFGFQFIAYLVYMGVANLVYNLGLILEHVRQPAEPVAFRQRLFGWLYGLALAAPLGFVGGVLGAHD